MARILILETHIIHQNIRNISLHISTALKCDYCKPNVPINMKICRFFEKKISLLFVLVAEVMSISLRANRNIKGLYLYIVNMTITKWLMILPFFFRI